MRVFLRLDVLLFKGIRELISLFLTERVSPEEATLAKAWPDQLKLKKLDDDLLGDEDDYDDEDYYDEDYEEDEEDDELYDDEEYYEDDYKDDDKVRLVQRVTMTIICLLRTAWATSRWRSTSPRTRPPHPPQARRPQDQQQQPRQQRRPRRRQQPQHRRHDLQQIPTSLTTTQETSTQPSCR